MTTPTTPTTTTSQKPMDYKIWMSDYTYQKIMYWVRKSNFECSGLGKVIREGNLLKIGEVIMLPQKNGAAHTDIEAEDVAKAMYTLRDSPGELRWWWHSHVNMGAFWSPTDITTIQDSGAGGWSCATVFNKRCETKSALYIKEPFEILLPDIGTETEQKSLPKEWTELWDGEYDDNVQKPSWERKKCDKCHYVENYCKCDGEISEKEQQYTCKDCKKYYTFCNCPDVKEKLIRLDRCTECRLFNQWCRCPKEKNPDETGQLLIEQYTQEFNKNDWCTLCGKRADLCQCEELTSLTSDDGRMIQ